MEQKRKKCKRVSRMLVEAQPQYVSIVNHPANLTPFKDIKMEKEINPAPLKAETETANTSGDTVANVCKKEANFTEGGIIKEFVFGASFKSEEDVQSYMTTNGWSGYKISKVEGGYVASGDYEGKALVDERVIAITDDVSVCVAKEQEPETKEEPVDTKKLAEVTIEKKSEQPAELTQKYDSMLAYGNTLDEALASGTSAYPTPIGFSEMFETFYNVLYVIYANPEVVDKDAYLKKACADFADILVKLNGLMASLIGSTDLAKKEAGEQWLNAIKNEKGLKMAEQETKEVVEAVKEEGTVAAEAPAAETPAEAPAEENPVTEAPAEETPAEQPAAEEAPVAPAEPAVAEEPKAEEKSEVNEVAELRKQVEAMQATIAELQSKAQKAEDAGADVEASPSKKSEIFETSGCASNESAEKAKVEKAEKAERVRNQLFGFFGV